ncbi:MAG: quinol:cytochrome C oxidoreductase, partial [Candidatus Nephrothrix sp. EaCA]
MEHNKHFVVGIFDDEDVLVRAVEKSREKGLKIHEVFSPFPVHGLEDALGYKRSRLPKVAFACGITGTTLALFTQIWMLGFDWPMNIGGKNHASLPPFIPVTFEFTVLLSALGMVLAFFIVSDMKPYKWPRQFDLRSTDDKHVMA